MLVSAIRVLIKGQNQFQLRESRQKYCRTREGINSQLLWGHKYIVENEAV